MRRVTTMMELAEHTSVQGGTARREGPTIMNMSSFGQTGVLRDRRSALRQMTPEQLLELGAQHLVYLKGSLRDGMPFFVLYRADGHPLACADAVEAVVEMAAEQGLGFVSVH
jgi:hypothetical protein